VSEPFCLHGVTPCGEMQELARQHTSGIGKNLLATSPEITGALREFTAIRPSKGGLAASISTWAISCNLFSIKYLAPFVQ
jgi:hypothetical protein